MSEPENFLARWSRRKAEAERPEDAQPQPARPESVSPATSDAPPAATSDKEEAAVDLSKLPSIDSIGPGTDISAFLQKGVPGDLARAALRRVWTSDPAIRDFIGIAENQYDFATGSDIPGFGPLTPADDVARMVAEIMREGVPHAPAPSAEEKRAENTEPKVEKKKEEAMVSQPTESEGVVSSEETQAVEVAALAPPANVAPQQKKDDEAPLERSHGRALPR